VLPAFPLLLVERGRRGVIAPTKNHMKSKYHKLTEDVFNPLRDKRCRYGIKSIPLFKAGDIVTERIEETEIAGIIVPVSHYSVNRGGKKYWDLPRNVFQAMETIPHELNPVEEYDANFAGYRQDNMLRDFLKRGVLKIEDIREYFSRD
jgi:hypothetical protein